jgi:glutamine synthetase type III
VYTVKKIPGCLDTLPDPVANMTEARCCVDKPELLVDDEDWPLVKYREMLLVR